ncbi:hypothetical protein TMatcc_000729 [Talaromyces marneffei ATCC 18224]
MAILAVNCFLRTQCLVLPNFLWHIDSSLCPLSEPLSNNDYASYPVFVSRHTAHGLCNTYQYALLVCLVCVPAWGQQAGYVALAMWIVDAVLSVFTCFGIIFIMITRRTKTKLGSMSVAWLLPSASCVVAAASGGIVAEVVPNSQIALEILVTSFILWGIGISLASMVIVIYLMRLMLHKLPPKAVIVSTFLPLFPIGEGGFGVAKVILPQTDILPVAASDALYKTGNITGLLFWAFGLFWLSLAVGSIARILSIAVVLLWILVAIFTVHGISNQTLFLSPCLAVWREKRRRELEKERFATIESS